MHGSLLTQQEIHFQDEDTVIEGVTSTIPCQMSTGISVLTAEELMFASDIHLGPEHQVQPSPSSMELLPATSVHICCVTCHMCFTPVAVLVVLGDGFRAAVCSSLPGLYETCP